MAQDKLAGIVRALVGVPQERLVPVQRVVNKLNKDVENADEFHRDLSVFVNSWKPDKPVSYERVTVDRATPFNPVEFIGSGWSIAEQDERSIALFEVNLGSIRFEHMLKSSESWVKGEDKLQRLKNAGHIRLDAKVLQTLWENKHLIPEQWKEKTNGNTTSIYFDGTVLRRPDGRRYVLCLCWRDGRWDWSCSWLGSVWSAHGPSVVLAS